MFVKNVKEKGGLNSANQGGKVTRLLICDSGGIQTPSLLIRSQMLYSVELRSQCACKGTTFFLVCLFIKRKRLPGLHQNQLNEKREFVNVANIQEDVENQLVSEPDISYTSANNLARISMTRE